MDSKQPQIILSSPQPMTASTSTSKKSSLPPSSKHPDIPNPDGTGNLRWNVIMGQYESESEHQLSSIQNGSTFPGDGGEELDVGARSGKKSFLDYFRFKK